MIASLSGKVSAKTSGSLVLEVSGVGYQVLVPGSISSDVSVGQRLSLFTSLVVREDAFTLFGFVEAEQLTLFDQLRGVSGVGPKTALAALSNLSAAQIANAVADIRRSKLPDPAQIGNAGSFFKNPILTKEQAESLKNLHPNMPFFAPKTENDTGSEFKTSAAWLIEQCGWKGHRRGAIGVSETHALVLVHYGDGKGEDLWQLAQDIRSSVRMEFGIDLEPEVNPVL